ncbi:sulfatase-like hydrolase/transferase [Candidatus Sumerlaeota bacterium]|nr:sulfatase-like hydrolase/transferase [Candidatus Sumerlaeota bacterium]
MKRRDFLKASALGLVALKERSLFGSVAPKKRPNILFFFPDQHRFDWTSMNPQLPDITPNLRRLAQNGVHFTNALTPSPLCAPARACLAAGKEYHRCRVSGNNVPYPLDQITFYTLLKSAGYHVLGCGKFDLDKPGMSWGRDGKHKRAGLPSLLEVWGFSDGIDNEGKMDGVSNYRNRPDRPGPYFDYLEKQNLVDAHLRNIKTLDHDYPGPSIVPDEAYCDNWIARNGLSLINAVPTGEPWFIQINFDGPHPPMDITKTMCEKWKEAKFPPAWTGNKAKKEETGDASRRNYGAMIANIDEWLGRFIAEIAKRGELDNTIIVYCSDHGEMLGDHGMDGKSKPQHPSVCVPLVIAGPGVRKSVTCEKPVETLDLTATFLDYAGVGKPTAMDSLSLRPYLEGKGGVPRGYVTSALGNWRLVFDGKYKLIVGDGEVRDQAAKQPDGLLLYDLKQDPHEDTNLSEKYPDVVERLKPLLPPENMPTTIRAKKKLGGDKKQQQKKKRGDT